MHDNESKVPEGESAREARRDFLKKAGRFAIYTPPAMMVLMKPGREAIAQSGNGDKAVDASAPPPKEGGGLKSMLKSVLG